MTTMIQTLFDYIKALLPPSLVIIDHRKGYTNDGILCGSIDVYSKLKGQKIDPPFNPAIISIANLNVCGAACEIAFEDETGWTTWYDVMELEEVKARIYCILNHCLTKDISTDNKPRERSRRHPHDPYGRCN